MASLPWVPWQTNRTEVLSQAQIERIVQMHRESKQNALIYVLVVLALYFVALAILVGRYLHHERDHDLAVCLGQVLERCVATCRRATATPASASPGATPTPAKDGLREVGPARAARPAAPVISITAAPAARKFSLKLPSWTAPPPYGPHGPSLPAKARTRPRAPQTDDDDSSDPPSAPCSPCSPCSPAADVSETPSCEARDMDSLDGLAWPGACHPCGLPGTLPGRASPAVISVMVCDLQDTQV